MGNCTRKRVRILGEHYYLVVGDDFVLGTVPRENDPKQSETREIVELLCDEITTLLQLRSKKCQI